MSYFMVSVEILLICHEGIYLKKWSDIYGWVSKWFVSEILRHTSSENEISQDLCKMNKN